MNAYEFIIKMKDMSSSTLRNVANSVGMAQRQIEGFQGSMNNASSVTESSTKKMFSSFGSLIGIVGAVGLAMAVMAGGKTLFNMGVEMEQTNVKFEVLLGSVDRAKTMIKALNEYANATPYSNEGIVKGAETMLGFGIAHEKVMNNMKMLGDVSMGNEGALSSLSLSFSQVMATGRLLGQDLNQMIGQGFNPLSVISKNTGISMGELKNQMEKGAISAEMVEEAFRLATTQGGAFYGMSDKMSKTAGGEFSTMMGTFKDSISKIGMAFAEWIKPIFIIGTSVANSIIPFAMGIKEIFVWVSQTKPLLFFLSAVIGGVALSMGIAYVQGLLLTYAMGGLSFSFGIASAAASVFNFILNMNPIARIIIGISALIAIVWTLWNRFEGFRGVVMGVWEVIKGFGTAIKEYVINRLKDLLAGLSGVGSALLAFFKGDFKEAWEIGKKATSSLLGVDSKKQFYEDGLKAVKSFNTGYANGVKMGSPEMIAKTVNEDKKQTDPFKQKKSSIFDSLGTNTGNEKGNEKGNAKAKGDSIVSGGSKQTTVNITIEKLGTDTTIHVDKSEKGFEKFQVLIQETLLRAVNSINQMQTS